MDKETILTRLEVFRSDVSKLSSLIKQDVVTRVTSNWTSSIDSASNKVWNSDTIERFDTYMSLCEQTLAEYDAMTSNYLGYDLRDKRI
jgi:hypothetical protein